MTREEKIICKSFLHDADNTHSCNEYKLLMELLEQEPTTKNDLDVDDKERELALVHLEQIKEDYIEGEGYERHPLPEYYAIETAIKSLALSSVTPQEPRWVPVSERLPNEGYSVLVMRITDDNYKYMRVATYQGDCWMDDTDKFNKPNPHKVIAWMPLPEPYKEDKE